MNAQKPLCVCVSACIHMYVLFEHLAGWGQGIGSAIGHREIFLCGLGNLTQLLGVCFCCFY